MYTGLLFRLALQTQGHKQWQVSAHTSAHSKQGRLTPAFVALLVEAPDKLFAHRTEGGLPEEGGDKLVVLDVVDLGLFNGSTTVHGWKLCLLLTTHRLFAIPILQEILHTHQHLGLRLQIQLQGWEGDDKSVRASLTQVRLRTRPIGLP